MKLCNGSNCNNPVFSKGFCRNHQYLKEGFDNRSIAAKGLEKALKERKKKAGFFDINKVEEELVVESKGGSALQRWFEDRRKEMTGVCDNCGGKTCKDDDKYWKFSIAHLLPKAYVKSLATHPSNWLELCHFGNGCHSQMDNKMLDLIDMHCFDKIVTRVSEMYPSIALEEKRRIPSILLEYIKTEI